MIASSGSFRPDGTGSLRIDHQSQPTIQQLSIDQTDVSARWFDIPEFGAWTQWSDPSLETRGALSTMIGRRSMIREFRTG